MIYNMEVIIYSKPKDTHRIILSKNVDTNENIIVRIEEFDDRDSTFKQVSTFELDGYNFYRAINLLERP
jgi:hypothetical protein